MLLSYMLLAFATSIYLILCFVWDIKGREIFTFPCTLLTGLWIVFAVMTNRLSSWTQWLYCLVLIVVFVIFNIKKIWGAGDSDLLMLLGAVYLCQGTGQISLTDFIALCFVIVLILLSAIIVGVIEAKIKNRQLGKDSSIAVAPGFAIVIICIMIGGFLRLWKHVITIF